MVTPVLLALTSGCDRLVLAPTDATDKFRRLELQFVLDKKLLVVQLLVVVLAKFEADFDNAQTYLAGA